MPLRPETSRYRWAPAPIAQPNSPNHRAVLALRPPTDETRYAVRTSWAETVAGETRRTDLEKTVGLRAVPHEDRWCLGVRTQAPRLLKADRTAFDDIGLLLADLYAELVFDLAPTGELLGLVNHAEIRAAWGRVQQALQRQYPAPSEVVDALVAGVGRQLARPAGLWPSLGYDYLYAALPGSFYQQPFATHSQYTRAATFPQFFDGLALHFAETLRLAAPNAPGRTVLRLAGALDSAATDVAAVAECVRAALGRAAVVPGDVQFLYEASHEFEPATGLPVAVDLTVRCTYHDLYCKEYHLAVAPLLPTP